ncbi:solute carrier family 35 member C2 [Onthophagus taurus]|uniref:solute carrier family 35 member C2 n=1 Tax=Onthophagus taurus TaxID=166361 RepID=UPI000C206408|nr:solute carrier family 35 member C2 [Onthophagus taurus]
MVWIRKKQKYKAVDSIADEDVDIEMPKLPYFTPSCVRASLITGALIAIYFAPSIGLTFYQRWLLQKFKFPLFTVLIHLVVKFLLAALWRSCASLKNDKPKLVVPLKDIFTSIAPPGFFSGIDIGFSNWGLELITISLYTMTKSTAVVFILGFAILFKLEKKTCSIWFIVIMISIGLSLFTYKSTQIDVLGFVLVLVASMCSGLRWTCVQLLLQKSKMGMKDPADMIYYMQPWMFLSVLPFALAIEGPTVYENIKVFPNQDNVWYLLLLVKVLVGACIAFFMEMSEVLVVTYTSSLTLSIAGIFKEIFVLVLAHFINGDEMSFINVIGLVVCLTGIITHVIHKIRNVQAQSNIQRSYNGDADGFEVGKSLIDNSAVNVHYHSDTDEENSDSQELFNILNRHDR